jgi:hypothetical protein
VRSGNGAKLNIISCKNEPVRVVKRKPATNNNNKLSKDKNKPADLPYHYSLPLTALLLFLQDGQIDNNCKPYYYYNMHCSLCNRKLCRVAHFLVSSGIPLCLECRSLVK